MIITIALSSYSVSQLIASAKKRLKTEIFQVMTEGGALAGL